MSSSTRSRAAGRPAARLREGRRQGADGKSPRHAAVHVGLEERLGGVRAGLVRRQRAKFSTVPRFSKYQKSTLKFESTLEVLKFIKSTTHQSLSSKYVRV